MTVVVTELQKNQLVFILGLWSLRIESGRRRTVGEVRSVVGRIQPSLRRQNQIERVAESRGEHLEVDTRYHIHDLAEPLIEVVARRCRRSDVCHCSVEASGLRQAGTQNGS